MNWYGAEGEGEDMMQYLDVDEMSLPFDGNSAPESTASEPEMRVKPEPDTFRFSPPPISEPIPEPIQSSFQSQPPVQMRSQSYIDKPQTRFFEEEAAQEFLSQVPFGCEHHEAPRGSVESEMPDHKEYPAVLNGHLSDQPLKYQVRVDEFPQRSRVETQIRCRLAIWPPPSETLLHLPADTMARPRFQLRNPSVIEKRPDVLWLQVDAVVPERAQERVYMCGKCLSRERKRAFRKKTLDPHEELHWHDSQLRRLLIFNCRELVALPPPLKLPLAGGEVVDAREFELPLRLACYCRHHAARSGYRLVFSLRDFRGQLVGRAVSTPVFITDNHKEPRGGSSAVFDDPGPVPSSRRTYGTYHPYAHSRSNSSDWSSSAHSSSAGPSPASSGLSAPSPSDTPSPMSSAPTSAPTPTGLTGLGVTSSTSSAALPLVQRVIPASGSVRGGVEITLLGQGFRPGLVALFGDLPAISTQCWSDSTVIAHLPPAQQAGTVPVTFEGATSDTLGAAHPALFTYINDGEAKLKELALQVVGFKLSGRIEDAGEIAQRILSEGQSQDASGSRTNDHAAPSAPQDSAETLALMVLKLIQQHGRVPQLNLRNSEGQTMMHLAAMLGYATVVRSLIAQGAAVASQDVSGLTPLHFAALFGQRAITRLLLDTGDADPFHVTRSGQTVADMADPTVIDLLPRDPRAYYQELNSRSSSSLISQMAPIVPSSSVVSEIHRPPTPPGDTDAARPPPYHQLYPSLGAKMPVIELDIDSESDAAGGDADADAESAAVSSAMEEEDDDNEDQNSDGDGDVDVDEDEDEDEDEEEPAQSMLLEKWATTPLKQTRNDSMLWAFWVPLFLIALTTVAWILLSEPDAGPWHEWAAAVTGEWVESAQKWGAAVRAKVMPLPPIERYVLRT